MMSLWKRIGFSEGQAVWSMKYPFVIHAFIF